MRQYGLGNRLDVFQANHVLAVQYQTCAIAIWLLLCSVAAVASGEESDVFATRESSFLTLDANDDQQLSIQEYAADSFAAKLPRIQWTRDFHLFDFNRDGKLSTQEFLAVPVDGMRCVDCIVPDPMETVLDRAIQAMDDSYDRWQHRPKEHIDSTMFIVNYAASLSEDGKRRLDRGLLAQADQNRDRKVSRDEAMQFLSMQLGVTSSTRERLRLSNGTVVDCFDFMNADLNHDGTLVGGELALLHDARGREGSFEEATAQLDRNGDSSVTLTEYSSSANGTRDPILSFCQSDTDFNGSLDEGELISSTPANRRHLVRSNLIAFDHDDDGELSLAEYRVSMLAHYNYPWEVLCVDTNSDGLLSFAEFEFSDHKPFLLLRKFFFHQLDRDGDGKLHESEFRFKRKKIYTLLRVSVDGEDTIELFRDVDLPVCSSPAVSPDGNWILFDATPENEPNRTQIHLTQSDGSDTRYLCDGAMPSWSQDATQFACSRYQDGSGVWIMNLDGTPHQRIDDGWSAQWSPDGKSIAYVKNDGLQVFDVQSGESRTLLEKSDHAYDFIYWNMAWSPDSKRLAFQGRKASRNEIALVNATGAPNVIGRHESQAHLADDLAWSADGRRILFNLVVDQRSLIHQLDPNGNDLPRVVPETHTENESFSVCFSPDGKWMVLASPK
ncbi:MAG: hypothetical protein AB8B91_09315 [Rubripirellula sp.]